MLRAEGVSLDWPGRTLVEGLSVEFKPGEIWAVLGRNGSGKSTLLHVLAGLAKPRSGTVMLDDAPVASMHPRALALRMGILLQEESREFWGSVRDYVLLGRYPHARSPFGWSIDDDDIAAAEMRGLHLDGDPDRAYASLSGGERQRARAAALLSQRPQAYLLDEPLQHLDLPHQVALLDRLAEEARNRDALVILVLHDLFLASRYCDRCLLLYGDGRYLAGPAGEALTHSRLGELYGFPLVAVEAGADRLFVPARGPGQGPHV